MPQPIKMLSGLTTAELTLTKRGANNRRFAMTKGGLPMDPEILAAIIGTPAEGEDTFLTVLKSQGVTDQDKIDAAVASFRMQKGMKDLISDDLMASVAKSAGYEGTAKAVDPKEGKDDKKPDAMSGKVDPRAKKGDGPRPVAKAVDLTQLDASTRTMVESVFKSHAAMEERADKLEGVVKSLQDQRAEIEYVTKAAQSYGHIPMPDQELGLMLKSAHEMNSDFGKGFEKLLERMDGMVEKSAMLTTMGAVSKSDNGGGWSKIETLAEGMVQKSMASESPITKAQAIDLVLKSEVGQDLYREYLGDNPPQRAEVY